MAKWQYLSLLRLESSGMIGGLGSGTHVVNGTEKKKVCGVEEVEVINFMNRLGEMGWELTSTVHHTTQAHASYTSYVFKRQAE